jgi:hypothetical protein
MRKATRAAVLGCAGALALAAAGQALAAYSPKLVVQQASGGTTLRLAIPSTDDPTAKLTFYAPAGTGANLSASAGSTIGTLDAKASAGALGGATLPLTGSVQVRAADGTYLSSGQQVPIATAATRCTGTATHAAYWVLVLSAAGQSLEVPLFVDPVPASQPFAPLVSFALTVCLPPSDIPESLGGAAFGAKVFEANFTVQGVFSAPSSGDNLWRLLATPYSLGKGTPNAAATVEAQSFVETATVTLAPPTRTLTRLAATFQASGTVDVTGLSDTTAAISLARGPVATRLAVFGHPAAKSDGTYSQRFSIRRLLRRAQVLFLQAAASAPQRDLAATACKASFGVPCIGATASGFAAKSATRRVVVPAIPRRR